MGQAELPYRTALVVEDDRDLRDLAATLLEETTLRVVEAESAEQALHFLRDRADEVAFAFVDVRLPCLMDGVDLARTVSLKWPWIRVVVTSGDPAARIDQLPRNATFMPKPWRAFDVLVEAERAIEDAGMPPPSPMPAAWQSPSH
ncbi:MAG TPA: response regulator [Microvirga sp.]|jgi:DNA-binding NtrC family response regulator|nr:response regulator [Microvirga sp.]